MGRTKRRRRRKALRQPYVSQDDDPRYVNLRRWMADKGSWKNKTRLRLTDFPDTGRGLSSPKNLSRSDVLISVPYELMITYATIKDSGHFREAFRPGTRLTIHELLAVFLGLEKHKSASSPFRPYIESLPDQPPPLPWLCKMGPTIAACPAALKKAAKGRLAAFEESWSRVETSIDPGWKCRCCGLAGNRVLTPDLFTWAYVMVNTRAVYVDRLDADANPPLLSDDPTMALCPYLDMFNHCSTARTQAGLERIDGKLCFQLRTLSPIKSHEQIFISYGAHDNLKLVCEYGFCLPANESAAVELDFRDLIGDAKASLDRAKYKFIKEKGFDRNLSVSQHGLSFNLKAVLFLIASAGDDEREWGRNVFGAGYSDEEVTEIDRCANSLLTMELGKFRRAVQKLEEKEDSSAQVLLDYLQYQTRYIEQLIVGVAL